MTSIELSNKYDKRHDSVLRDIRIFIKKNPELSHNFIESTYKTNRGKEYPSYILNKEAESIFKEKYKFNIRSARFEYKMLNEICDFLDGLHIKYIKQYPVLSYRIDLFLPEYNLSVEYDEKEHKYKQEYDRNRENNIADNIGCKFVRIKEDETVGSAIAKILMEMKKYE